MEILKISLAAARVNVEMTQDDVCERLKISKPTLVSYEKGLSTPSFERGNELAALYGLSIDNIDFLRKSTKLKVDKEV